MHESCATDARLQTIRTKKNICIAHTILIRFSRIGIVRPEDRIRAIVCLQAISPECFIVTAGVCPDATADSRTCLRERLKKPFIVYSLFEPSDNCITPTVKARRRSKLSPRLHQPKALFHADLNFIMRKQHERTLQALSRSAGQYVLLFHG
jgi:hypothetical protein